MKRIYAVTLAALTSSALAAAAYGQGSSKESGTQNKNAETTESSGAPETQEQTKTDQEPAFVIMHYAVATETGCWATFYDDENFKGTSITLTGRSAMPDVDFDLKPYRIGGEPDSVVVGPEATLELFGDEGFKDRDHIFVANERIADLSQKPFWDDIESVRLKCAQPQPK